MYLLYHSQHPVDPRNDMSSILYNHQEEAEDLKLECHKTGQAVSSWRVTLLLTTCRVLQSNLRRVSPLPPGLVAVHRPTNQPTNRMADTKSNMVHLARKKRQEEKESVRREALCVYYY